MVRIFDLLFRLAGAMLAGEAGEVRSKMETMVDTQAEALNERPAVIITPSVAKAVLIHEIEHTWTDEIARLWEAVFDSPARAVRPDGDSLALLVDAAKFARLAGSYIDSHR